MGHLAMMSGRALRMLAGRSEMFLGRPAKPGGRLTDSPCSSTLLALPMVLLSPVSAKPKPTLAIFLMLSYSNMTASIKNLELNSRPTRLGILHMQCYA